GPARARLRHPRAADRRILRLRRLLPVRPGQRTLRAGGPRCNRGCVHARRGFRAQPPRRACALRVYNRPVQARGGHAAAGGLAADARPNMNRAALIFSLLAAAVLALLLGACTSAGYYWQGIAGELDLLNRAQPIPAVVETTSDPALKRKLERVLSIREFASR